jgi:hypothetical protein
MHRDGYFARRRLGKPNFSFGFERTHYFNPEIHIHRQIPARGMVIEKHVVAVRAQVRMRPQEFPHLIECGPPCGPYTADCDFAPDGGNPH